ncbi:hypothetical protein L1987_13645 [Smallanthus sonchifolius]|uniref:Uncharacterized protein n=1 Tax=Smallanthus sonchifolius TaxID=185202 RepID=A0ACB9JIM8_9ASTR|nr:hypothetical protein L1987_13645 [Smallanthus sonchifolius]
MVMLEIHFGSSVLTPDSRSVLFDDHDEVKGSGLKVSYESRNKYKNDFVDSGGIENQDLQELEHYAANLTQTPTNIKERTSTNTCILPIPKRTRLM